MPAVFFQGKNGPESQRGAYRFPFLNQFLSFGLKKNLKFHIKMSFTFARSFRPQVSYIDLSKMSMIRCYKKA